MENIIERCAICGCCWFIGELERRRCLECSYERDDRKAIVYKSTKPQEYYEELSRKEYGDSTHWEEIFVREELSKNPSKLQ